MGKQCLVIFVVIRSNIRECKMGTVDGEVYKRWLMEEFTL